MNREQLQGFERVAVPTLEALHGHDGVRRAVHTVIGGFNATWIQAVTQRLWRIYDFEHVEQLRAPRGIIVVTNHRSFFDMYLFGTPLDRRTSLYKRICFPVRSDFFYTSATGMLLNIAVSGGSMWPPVFRSRQRAHLNRVAWSQLAEVMVEGSAVGIHPEGKRNPSPDPYTFLPVKAGLGHLIAECPPETMVVPGFVAGVGNDWRRLVTRGWRPEDERGEPIRMWYGKPVSCGDLQALNLSALATTERVFDEVRKLGEKDRAERDAGAW
ncbi:MAG: 1-acyl-sn-glycerol-3-phosphate acyltransferase [Myxococcales bacterium]|nr:1-acyl-sn-glycerol-3-phosphate acyltransferase [Myxococcales bacterium]